MTHSPSMDAKALSAKVPEVTLPFWVIKILATTLGESGGDALSMSMHLGYLLSTGIFAVLFLVAVAVQIRAKQFHSVLFWAAFILTRALGAVVGDFLDKPIHAGGLDLSRFAASAVLLAAITVFIAAFRHRPARLNH